MVDALSGPGSSSTQQFAATLSDALNNPAVEQILIDIDSPDGSVYGVEELATQILSARGQKPVVAVANSLAASAAYWIGSAASEFIARPAVRWAQWGCGRPMRIFPTRSSTRAST